jgi:archaellum component FlaC
MMLQKTLQIVTNDMNILQEQLIEIIDKGGRIDHIITNTHSRGEGWLVIYTPRDL